MDGRYLNIVCGSGRATTALGSFEEEGDEDDVAEMPLVPVVASIVNVGEAASMVGAKPDAQLSLAEQPDGADGLRELVTDSEGEGEDEVDAALRFLLMPRGALVSELLAWTGAGESAHGTKMFMLEEPSLTALEPVGGAGR